LLWQIDAAWATEKANAIFPAAEEERPLWEAAWSSYLAYGTLHADIRKVLKEQYALAADRLGDESILPKLPVDLGKRLAEHLMALYWNGLLSPEEENGTLQRFWEKASPKVRGHALWFVGRSTFSLKEGLQAATAERLKRLWEQRLSVAQASADKEQYQDEVAKFGWWFCSGRFPDDWSLQQLESALAIANTVEPDFEIYRRLAAVSSARPQQSVRCLERMVLNDKAFWQISAHATDIRKTLESALGSGGLAAGVARNIANVLGRRGIVQFRDLAG
jgi:hypothetical protein